MNKLDKIIDINDLAIRVEQFKADGKKVVLAHGVFDLLHVGHIRHFEEAKRQGDILIVTLTPDQYVNKGPHRPAFPQQLRAEAIASLASVDCVAINRWPSSVETIKLLKPDIYVKGSDYKDFSKDVTGGIILEVRAVEEVGGEIHFTDDITFSSSKLLNEHFSAFDADVNEYLREFRARYSVEEVLGWLDKIAQLRPVVIGEAIIDEYLFGDAIGKSSKDPVLAVLEQNLECYAGGSLAIANHLAGLCESIELVTQLGDSQRREEWIRSVLRPNIRPHLLSKTQSPTIHKRRIVDRYTGTKLLELYSMNDKPTAGADVANLKAALAGALKEGDVALVADYGHGMMTPDIISSVECCARFLAVNVQSNAGNRGFNPVSKYKRADYVCLANHELEMEMRQRGGNAEEQLLDVVSRLECKYFTVTMGKHGMLHYNFTEGIKRAPALASRVLDRVGAGDAVLAVTSLLVKLSAPGDIVAFVGNVAGAHLVAELGNRVPLDRVALSKHITSLLK